MSFFVGISKSSTIVSWVIERRLRKTCGHRIPTVAGSLDLLSKLKGVALQARKDRSKYQGQSRPK